MVSARLPLHILKTQTIGNVIHGERMPQFEPTLDDELEVRYGLVREKIGAGMEQRHFVKWALENTDWGLSDRQLRNYYHTVQERLQQEVTEHTGRDTVQEYARHLERLDYLYRQATAANDNRTALLIAKEYADFRDLKNPQNQIDWREVAKEFGLSTDITVHMEALERLAMKEVKHHETT